jgi:hypothetical protein
VWTYEDARNSVINNFSDMFDQIRKKASVKKGTFHDFRRTAITNWFYEGLEIVEVMKLAGHSKYETTLKYYLHVKDDLVDKVRRAIRHRASREMLERCLGRGEYLRHFSSLSTISPFIIWHSPDVIPAIIMIGLNLSTSQNPTSPTTLNPSNHKNPYSNPFAPILEPLARKNIKTKTNPPRIVVGTIKSKSVKPKSAGGTNPKNLMNKS